MPAITSATWRVQFKRNSLTDNLTYWQDFSITLGKQPALDFEKEIKRKGYVDIEIILIATL